MWDMAAESDGEFRVWRMVFGQTECMMCKHPEADDSSFQTARAISQATGLAPDVVHHMIATNARFTASDCEIVAATPSHDSSLRVPNPGEPSSDWYADHCGRYHFRDLDQTAPIPFAPVLAGVLAAGEIIKEHYFPDHVLLSRLMSSVLHRPFASAVQNRRPHRDCPICHDTDLLAQYRRRWSTA